MTDKINNISGPINGSNLQNTSKGASNTNSKVSGNESANVASSGKVDISSAQTLDKIRESLASEPVIDRQKVETVKQALQDGTYNINSENIATKLIEIEQLLK
ncbi:MAG: flagellar biosynthesis anti-sigma factor FlgM [Gammaproteobacteria bacterium]